MEANFLKVSPSYLTALAGDSSNGSYTGDVKVAISKLQGGTTSFYIVRHAAYNSLDSTEYRLSVSTSAGDIVIPQLSPALTLNGRDSKFHVTDYDIGGIIVRYSSAEIFTWYVLYLVYLRINSKTSRSPI